MADPAPQGRKRLVLAFWVAVGLSVALHLLQPYGRYALYPFSFLSTWAHEMGHGLMAILVGGEFSELELLPNLGGTAYTRKPDTLFAQPLVSAAGLLGPAIAGAFVIVLGARSERMAKAALFVVTGALGLSLLFWIRTPFGAGMSAAVCLALAALALKGNAFFKLLVTQLLGIQLCLGSLGSFDYMFTSTFERGGKVMRSDTQAIADSLLLPYWVWGTLIAALSLLILAAAFYFAWVRGAAEGVEAALASRGKPTPAPQGPAASTKAPSPQAPSGGAEAILDELGG